MKTLRDTQGADLQEITGPLLTFPPLIIFKGRLVCRAIAGKDSCCRPLLHPWNALPLQLQVTIHLPVMGRERDS